MFGIAVFGGYSQTCIQSIDVLIAQSHELRALEDPKCLDLAQTAYNLSLSCNDSVKNEALILKAFCYYTENQYDTVVAFMSKALPFAQKHAYYHQISLSAELLYLAYKSLKNDDLALKYADLGVEYSLMSKDTLQWLLMIGNRANLKAFENIDEAISDYAFIRDKSKGKEKLLKPYGIAMHNLATLYSMNDDFELAIHIYDTLLNIPDQSGTDKYFLHFNRGLCNYDLGNTAKGLEEIKHSLTYLSTLDHKLLAESKETISLLHQELGQTDSALAYMEEAYFDQQALYTTTTAEEVAKLREQLEAEQRELQIERLDSEKNMEGYQKRIFIGLSISLVLILLLSLILYRNRLKSQQLLSKQKIKQLEKEKEVLSLQSMLFAQEEERQRIALDLHDSIGALLSTAKLHMSNIEEEINALANLNIVKTARAIIENASSEVRRVAHNMMPGVLMKLGLEEGLEDFFENVRKGQNLQVSFVYDELPQRLENKKEVMLFRMLQEMTNNTLKHAKASEIKVMLKVVGNQLTLDYRDDGIGFDTSKMNDQSSFGLAGLKSRADFIGATLQVDSSRNRGVHFLVLLEY